MAHLVTQLTALTPRQIEALLHVSIRTVEDAHEYGGMAVARLLLHGIPVLSLREIDQVLKVLFRVD